MRSRRYASWSNARKTPFSIANKSRCSSRPASRIRLPRTDWLISQKTNKFRESSSRLHPRTPHTNPLGPLRPTHNSAARTFREPTGPKAVFRYELDGSLTHLAVGELDTHPLPDPMGGVALLARCLPVRFQIPSTNASAFAARSSFVASVAHCRLPRAPSAGVLSASWLGRQSCLRQTRIPCGSPKTTPPLPSNPRAPPLQALARIRVPIPLRGWAKTNFRTGPHIRIPKSLDSSSSLLRYLCCFVGSHPITFDSASHGRG